MPSQAPRQISAIVASNIRRGRDAAQLRQRDVAARLDTDVMTVSRWERGLHLPSDESLIALADIFGVDYGWFFIDSKELAA